MSEQISALADGEMDVDECHAIISSILTQQKSATAWRDYQLIGDVMRNDLSLGSDFKQKVMQGIEQEPTVLSPNAIARQPDVSESSLPLTENRRTENRRKVNDKFSSIWTIAASCAAVLVVGLVLVNQQDKEFLVPQMAQTSTVDSVNSEHKIVATADAVTPNSAVVRNVITIQADDIPEEYLNAHHVSAPSVGSYYIQTVNYSK